MRIHELKTWPPSFEQILSGRKSFELRFDDRGFQVGDVLCLREYDPLPRAYTVRSTMVRVTHIMTHDYAYGALLPGFAILGISTAPLGVTDPETGKPIFVGKAKAAALFDLLIPRQSYIIRELGAQLGINIEEEAQRWLHCDFLELSYEAANVYIQYLRKLQKQKEGKDETKTKE